MVGPPCQSYWYGRGNADQCLPGSSPTNRVGQAGRSEAKQAKTPVSTLPLFFFSTLEAGCGIQATGPRSADYYPIFFGTHRFYCLINSLLWPVKTRTAPSKARQASFAPKVCNGAKPRVRVLFTGIGHSMIRSGTASVQSPAPGRRAVGVSRLCQPTTEHWVRFPADSGQSPGYDVGPRVRTRGDNGCHNAH